MEDDLSRMGYSRHTHTDTTILFRISACRFSKGSHQIQFEIGREVVIENATSVKSFNGTTNDRRKGAVWLF